jgi:molybdopterin converting factor small subunit
LLPCCAIAVGDEIVARDYVLRAGDEVAVLPPVSGG